MNKMGKRTMKDYLHKVQYYETDMMGITHHSNYIRWMEEARVDYLSQIGWDYAKLEKEGIISPVLNVTCNYKKPTFFSDLVTINVTVHEFTGVKLHLVYEMKNGKGQIVCTGTSSHAFLNAEGRPIRMKKEQPNLFEVLNKLAAKAV